MSVLEFLIFMYFLYSKIVNSVKIDAGFEEIQNRVVPGLLSLRMIQEGEFSRLRGILEYESSFEVYSAHLV